MGDQRTIKVPEEVLLLLDKLSKEYGYNRAVLLRMLLRMVDAGDLVLTAHRNVNKEPPRPLSDNPTRHQSATAKTRN